MADNDYENYSDDDYLAELKDYVDAAKKEKEQDEAERRKQLAEMVGGFMGLWWYLRSFSASTARNIRTYAAIADREAKVAAWKSAADREKELSQYRDLPGSKDQQVMIINEFGACQYCLPYVGKTYSLGDAQTLVPFHPNCRCTLVRVEDESNSGIAVGIAAGAVANLLDSAKEKIENGNTDDLSQEELNELGKDFISELPDKVTPQQSRHIPGAENYKEGKSILSPTLYEKVVGKKNAYTYPGVERLYNQYSGTGKFDVKSKNGKITSVQERIISDEIIGLDVNLDSEKLTTGFKIHYSKKGYHIVPWTPYKGE